MNQFDSDTWGRRRIWRHSQHDGMWNAEVGIPIPLSATFFFDIELGCIMEHVFSFNNMFPLIPVWNVVCDRHAWVKEQEIWFPILRISHLFYLCVCVCVHVEMLFLELGGMCDTKMLLGTTAREGTWKPVKYWTWSDCLFYREYLFQNRSRKKPHYCGAC